MSMIIAISVLSAAAVALVVANVIELRRLRRAERDARESERHYRLLAESSFDMLVRFDPIRQQRTYVSPAVGRLYGYTPEEAMAMSAEKVIHPDDLPGVYEALHRLEQGEVAPVIYRGKRKDGGYIWVEASLKRLVNPETGQVEVVSVVRDVGERIRYQDELRRAKEQADAASRAKSEFLGTMSHELRTPLNAIIGFTELMKDGVMGPIENPHYRSYIADIHFSSTHLLNLINDILDVTKAEAGELDLKEDFFDLRQLIETVVRVSGPPIDKAGLAAAVDFPSDLPLLRADERKVRQVFFNLIGNAVKFTPPGGRIDILGRFDKRSGIAVTVKDTGIGITPENLARVLEPFVQIGSPVSRHHAGTGLGLPATKRIMELHQGALSLQSAPGVGTEATVIFPPERAVAASDVKAAVPAA